MGTAKATKAADKSQVCRKLVQALQKLYGKSVPAIDLPVVETMLFAVCLEDNSWAAAESGLKTLLASCFDLNEVRVSSVNELEQTLSPLREAHWKGLRIRSVLRHIFETTYSYDFEKLRRQTLEQAIKTLKKFHDVTPFMRDFVLHEILGSHIVMLDNSMLNAARWLGLVPAGDNLHDASEFLKGGLKKSEVSEFCHLLRCLATDPKFIPRFADTSTQALSMSDVMDRLVELQSPPKKRPSKPVPAPEPLPADRAPARKSANVGAPAVSSKHSKPAVDTAKTNASAKSVVAAHTGKPPATKSTASTKPQTEKPAARTESSAKSAAGSKQNKATAAKTVSKPSKKPSAPVPKSAAKTTKKK